jgi:hypothetical protein
MGKKKGKSMEENRDACKILVEKLGRKIPR